MAQVSENRITVKKSDKSTMTPTPFRNPNSLMHYSSFTHPLSILKILAFPSQCEAMYAG